MALLQYQRENLHFLSEEVLTFLSAHLLVQYVPRTMDDTSTKFGLADSTIAGVFK